MEVYRTVAPGGLDHAQTLDNLGAVEIALGNETEAERLFRESLGMIRETAPGSYHEGIAGDHLGTLLRDRGDLEEAEAVLTRALEIFERLSPGSLVHSDALFELGRLHLARNEVDPALGYFMRSLDAFENQRGRLGGSEEIRARYTERYGGRYRELMEIFLREGRPKDAFHILERSRAQGLLRMLAEREMVFDADVPAEMEWERILVNQEYDKVQHRLQGLSPEKEPEKIEEDTARMQELREKQDAIRERIRKRSPRLASLRYPRPLTFDETRKLLDPGTLMLSYSVGRDTTILFAVEKGLPKPRVVELEVGRADLERAVRRLRSEVRSLGNSRDMDLKLCDWLLEPIMDRVSHAKRLMICPDGPLHFLPFGLLVRRSRIGHKSHKKM